MHLARKETCREHAKTTIQHSIEEGLMTSVPFARGWRPSLVGRNASLACFMALTELHLLPFLLILEECNM